MDLFEAIWTTRAMRRLDSSQDVSDNDIHQMIEAAMKGPSGGNQQPMRFIVVRDSETRARIGVLYRECWEQTRGIYGADPAKVLGDRILNSADHLAQHLGEAPVLIIACAATRRQVPMSVYPSVQNLMLAGRALGLGTTLTTVHLNREDELKAILEMPEDSSTYAIIPVGVPLGRWAEAQRQPVEEVTFLDRWGSRALADQSAS